MRSVNAARRQPPCGASWSRRPSRWWEPHAGRARSAPRCSRASCAQASTARSTRSIRTPAGSTAFARTGQCAHLPEAPELAVIAVSAAGVPAVARDCALRGVRALLVLTAGFAETGPEGAALQDELLAICRASGMRLVGPELPRCDGYAETPGRDLRATRRAPGARGAAVTERWCRARPDRAGGRSRARPVVLRLDRQQARHLGERRPRVLGGGRVDGRGAALPGVVRQPTQLRADRAPAGAPQAGRRATGRAVRGGGSCCRFAHGRRGGRVRIRARGVAPAGRRHQSRQHVRAVRPRSPARLTAAASRAAGRDRHQRGRPRDPVRGRV